LKRNFYLLEREIGAWLFWFLGFLWKKIFEFGLVWLVNDEIEIGGFWTLRHSPKSIGSERLHLVIDKLNS